MNVDFTNLIQIVSQLYATVFGELVPEIKILKYENQQLKDKIIQLEESNRKMLEKLLERI